ncbi:hypothetical protein HYH02_008787 [Chlamydomonas schloesseri]|uniref:Ribonuclease H n=1 Tax=Chlamydomonas schloesseri TaxID=2026947 RepID=A0A835WDK6_9CHLO|nr:hypothetical protein HYH02_008787 [Chlamydomonas schloesseri]|eukprot:KAG2445321.1 hypothetical protein HYH02_008787 [Chlamydomonas schloesseri]
MGKYYAVRVGRKPGIYSDWAEVKPLVDGYAGAQHKSFKSRSEAEAYLGLNWIERGERAGSGGKRSRDAWDDDDDEDTTYQEAPPPAPALRHNPYLPPSSQNARQPPPRSDERSGRGASSSGRTAASAPVQPTIGVVILGRGAPEARAASGARHLTTARAAGVSGGGVGSGPGGGSRSGGRYEPVIEGPLQPINSGTLYQLEFDGAARGNPGQAGCGAVLRRGDSGTVVCRLRKYMGASSTNNEAEYTALLEGLRMAKRLGVRRLEAKGDSKLVVMQVEGKWKVNAENLRPLREAVMQEVRGLDFKISHIPREWNADADKLSNDAIDLAYS